MKKISLLFLITIFALASQAQISHPYEVSKFKGEPISSIRASGSFKISVTQGSATSATVSIPERYKDNLIFELDEKGTLTVGLRDVKSRKPWNDEPCTLTVVCISLKEARLSGACTFDMPSGMTTPSLRFELSGATEVSAGGDVNVGGRFELKLSGASKLRFNGRALDCNIEASGASELELGQFVAVNLTARLSGASEMECNVTGEFRAQASGASTIYYKGSPRRKSVESSGASRIQPR
ncbi:MAG: head GIN domain-containing protein [Mucinivorans sp.]